MGDELQSINYGSTILGYLVNDDTLPTMRIHVCVYTLSLRDGNSRKLAILFQYNTHTGDSALYRIFDHPNQWFFDADTMQNPVGLYLNELGNTSEYLYFRSNNRTTNILFSRGLFQGYQRYWQDIFRQKLNHEAIIAERNTTNLPTEQELDTFIT